MRRPAPPRTDVAHPARLLAHEPPELEPCLGHRAVVRDDRPQLVPVRLGVAPRRRLLVEPQLGVGDDQAELADPRHVDRQELLAQLLGGLGLDPPVQVAVLLARRARAVHLHQRAPPAVERVLDRGSLLGVPVTMVTTTSRPCMMWTDSSQQILRIVRAYGA